MSAWCFSEELRSLTLPARQISTFVLKDGFADYFLDGGNAVVDGAQTGLAQADHAVADAGRAQIVGRGAGGDHVAQVVVHEDQLVDSGAALVAGVVAAVAAAAVVELLALDILRLQ